MPRPWCCPRSRRRSWRTFTGIHGHLKRILCEQRYPLPAQLDEEKRQGWIARVDKISALKPKVVVAGHKDPTTRYDDAAGILDATRNYIADFDPLVPQCSPSAELIDKMLQRHGERGNLYTPLAGCRGVAEQFKR
jgi:hypothetical protein